MHWHPGKENLGDYASKHHEAAHHKMVRPIYLHEENSPLVLERALTPKQVRALGFGTPAPLQGKNAQVDHGRRQLPHSGARTPLRVTQTVARAWAVHENCHVAGPSLLQRERGPRLLGFDGLRGCVGNMVGSNVGQPPANHIPTGQPTKTI